MKKTVCKFLTVDGYCRNQKMVWNEFPEWKEDVKNKGGDLAKELPWLKCSGPCKECG